VQQAVTLVVPGSAQEGGAYGQCDRNGIPAGVAIQFAITDAATIVFAQVLYEAVADGRPLEAAMAEARKAIYAEDNLIEWGTPVLYLRAWRGRIFDVPRWPRPTRAPAETSTVRPTGKPAGRSRSKPARSNPRAYVPGPA
jgi:hypothetical protein